VKSHCCCARVSSSGGTRSGSVLHTNDEVVSSEMKKSYADTLTALTYYPAGTQSPDVSRLPEFRRRLGLLLSRSHDSTRQKSPSSLQPKLEYVFGLLVMPINKFECQFKSCAFQQGNTSLRPTPYMGSLDLRICLFKTTAPKSKLRVTAACRRS
jgi:hypothetical protein